MSVLSRSALEASPLSDLHTLAAELGIDGYRRLRKAELIDRILGEAPAPAADEDVEEPVAVEEPEAVEAVEAVEEEEEGTTDEDAEDRPRSRRGRRGGRGRRAARDADEGFEADEEEAEPRGREERVAEGVVELLGNGSGFLRVAAPEVSDDDVYISAAQVRRCELVAGDRVAGPVRAPRRSERYPSLIRVDTINGRPADEVAEGVHFDDLPAAFPSERIALGSDDATLKAIEWLTPIGRGSRVTIVGPSRSGKSETLRLIAGALAKAEGLETSVVLAGVRPEEVALWTEAGIEPAAAQTLTAAQDAQGQAVDRAVETAKRVAARGGHAIVLVDSLDGLQPAAARKALAAARNIPDGGTLTVIATASAPLGGETTVIALDLAKASTGRFPALDLVASGTLRPELLVGQAGADEIAKARLEAQS
ncbi:MAG TPA: Rho termination factor N-terminal domain-containing protein [Solirubrobacteraceae bacterium]|nr:Rho termination factor N-terminal domain-containing protein [Solirubrobacteraceae bacterium]